MNNFNITANQSIGFDINLSSPVDYYGILKRWNGSSWVPALLKRWNGSSWENKPLKIWTGSEWGLVNNTGV